MKLLISSLVLLLLTACATSNVKQPIYLSEPDTVDELLEITQLNNVGKEILGNSDGQLDDSIKDEFLTAYDTKKIHRDFREYFLMNVPQSNIQAWIKLYSSDFQQKVIKLEYKYKDAEKEPDFQERVQEIQQTPQLVEKLDVLFQLMQLEDEVFIVLKDGLMRPLIYGGAMVRNAGKSVDQALLDQKIDQYIEQAKPTVFQAMRESHYYTYSKLSGEELDKLITYYRSEGAVYFINTITSALGYALGNASEAFNVLIQKKTKAVIQTARFDIESCLEIHPSHICEILNVSSLGKKSPLFIGGAMIPKSGTYRLMAPNNDWQQIKLGKEYIDDLLVARKDGRAFLSAKIVTNSEVKADQYAQEQLGDILKQLDAEAYEFELTKFTAADNGKLHEICYVYDEKEVCKLTGARKLAEHSIYILAFFERKQSVIDEIISIITSFEPIDQTVAQ